MMNEPLKRLVEFCRSIGTTDEPPMSPKFSGPHRKPIQVSDSWPLALGITLVVIAVLSGLAFEAAC